MSSTNQIPDKFFEDSDLENFERAYDITEPSEYDYEVVYDAFQSIENYFGSDLDFKEEFEQACNITEHLFDISNEYLKYSKRDRENISDIKRIIKRLEEIMEYIPYWSSNPKY